MARPKALGDTVVKSIRLPVELWRMLIDLAALQTVTTGRNITSIDLIREAIEYTFCDNERLRECFRRSRVSSNKRFK